MKPIASRKGKGVSQPLNSTTDPSNALGAIPSRLMHLFRCQRREDFFLAFFLPGIIFFTALPVARAAFVTAFAARETVDLFFAFLAIITSWISTS
jgi:hypothetical protein